MAQEPLKATVRKKEVYISPKGRVGWLSRRWVATCPCGWFFHAVQWKFAYDYAYWHTRSHRRWSA